MHNYSKITDLDNFYYQKKFYSLIERKPTVLESTWFLEISICHLFALVNREKWPSRVESMVSLAPKQSFRRGVAIAESWFFHLWYLTEYKWEKCDFQTVCAFDLDEGLCKRKIGKNDAIAMLLAVIKNFFQSNSVKKQFIWP